MKHAIVLIALIVLIFTAKAQNSLINVSESQLLIDGVMINVASAKMTGEMKDIQKEWENYIKDQLDSRLKEKNGVYYIEETVINKITDKRGDVISYIYVFDNSVSFNFAYKLGYDVYVNSLDYPLEFNNQIGFVNHFLTNYYINYLPKKIKEVKKEQKKLLKEYKKSNKIIAKTEKENKKLEKQNANPKEKTDIKLNAEQINVNTSLIESKSKFISDIDPKIKSVKDELSTYELTLEDAKTRKKLK